MYGLSSDTPTNLCLDLICEPLRQFVEDLTLPLGGILTIISPLPVPLSLVLCPLLPEKVHTIHSKRRERERSMQILGEEWRRVLIQPLDTG